SAGTHTIQAVYNPPQNTYTANSAEVTQKVNAASTVITIGPSANPVGFAQPFTVFAHVGNVGGSIPPTGSVLFIIDGSGSASPLPGNPNPAPLDASGNASFTTIQDLGSHKVQAVYIPNNGNFTGSNSDASGTTFNEQVNPAPTTTSLSSSTAQAGLNQAVTFTAVVSAAPSVATPTGSVTFRVNGTPGAQGGLSGGKASFTTSSLPTGTASVSATYSPDSPNFMASGSSINQEVKQHYFAVGAGAGFQAIVRVFNPVNGALVTDLAPFGG